MEPTLGMSNKNEIMITIGLQKDENSSKVSMMKQEEAVRTT